MVTKTESIKLFLGHKSPEDLSRLYNLEMEVQVNVAQGEGERTEGEYKGRTYHAWTDGETQWKNIRIPWNANTIPEYNDSKINFDLAVHCEGIGLTGWNWKKKESHWVGFDFDAIVGHSEKHLQTLSDTELQEVQKLATRIPWVTVRRSTGGNGLHLYVFVDPVSTENHTEHMALARAILGKMSAITGFDFNSKVDNCGGILWFWHRKLTNQGLRLIKKGEVLFDIPINWKDHIVVTSGKRKKSSPSFVDESELDWFEELAGQHPHIKLDEEHKALISFLEGSTAEWWWDKDLHMLVTHTWNLKQAYTELNMKGIYNTLSTGSETGSDQNCFMFPMRRGGWVVRRHTKGVQEAASWAQDTGGWTKCYLNREPDLGTAAKTHGGAEDENGSFMFQEAEIALKAISDIGIHIDINEAYSTRQAVIKPHRDGRLILEIAKEKSDPAMLWQGWVDKKTKWRKVLQNKVALNYEPEVNNNYDDILRHLISESGSDQGWMIKADEVWCEEPLAHLKLALKTHGLVTKEIDLILGQSIVRNWKLVNRPFQPEYPGDRTWNRNAAQFSVSPSIDLDNIQHNTWDMLLAHCGKGLDSTIKEHNWCQNNGINNGADYLKLWIASMFQEPYEPTPYLFLFGEQGAGKSMLHEALELLIIRGVVRADAALISGAGFNGELRSAILCVVEETDLRQNKGTANNRIKDWVTGLTINIHVKGETPILTQNSTHWMHLSNHFEECPIWPGDTRITMVKVEKPEKLIPKKELLRSLMKEASDFLYTLLNFEIPKSNDRLNVPIIETEEKIGASKLNQSEIDAFIEELVFKVPGEKILYSEFYDRFKEWLDPERRSQWTKPKLGRSLPAPIVKGRSMQDGARHFIANVSWVEKEPGELATLEGDKIIWN